MVDKLYLELTRVQVLGRSRASLWTYSALFVIAPHPQQSRNYGRKALLCTRKAFPHTTLTRKSIKWRWAEPFEMNVKIEQELNFVVDKDRRLFLDAQEAKKVSERTVDR